MAWMWRLNKLIDLKYFEVWDVVARTKMGSFLGTE